MIWIVVLIGLAGVAGAFAAGSRGLNEWVRGTLVALGLGSSAASIVVVRHSPFETVWYFAPVFSVLVAGMLWLESPEGRGHRYR